MNKELSDLAWSVLPKEFKEEVKKLYSRFLFTREGYYDELFGKHNLTSDAEGEVELLHVTRQKVMGLYANAKKLHDLYTSATCINTTESQQIDICTGTMSVLTNLFGSKCLPDNVDSLSQNPPQNCDNGNHISTDDNKPAEPKFKVGDNVYTRIYTIDKDAHKGEIIDANCCGDSKCYKVRISNAIWTLMESDLEPYIEPEEVAKMKPIASMVSVYLATKEEDGEFRQFLHENGFKWNGGTSLISSSCWSPALEEDKIHYVYPDKTVTYCGDKTSDTLTFSEFKKQYFGESSNAESAALCPQSVKTLRIASEESHLRNLSQETANCDKQFDTILKDSFRNERRLNIATQIMSAILSNQRMLNNLAHGETTAEGVVKCVVDATMMYTDVLISACEKGGSHV